MIVAALMAGGCRSDNEAAATAASACSEELSREMSATLAEGRGLDRARVEGILATDRAPSAIPRAPLVLVKPDGAAPPSLDGLSGADLLIVPHRDSRWSAIVELAGAARERGFERLHLVVGARSRLESPPPSAGQAFAGCEPARAVAGRREPADVERSAGELAAAIESCGCTAERVEAARSILWTWLERVDSVAVTATAVELGPGDTGLVLDGAMTWADAEPSVRGLEGRVVLGIAD